MSFIYQSAFLKALGWSLVNSLWQMGILWLVYICITANSRKFSAAIRHTLALLAVCVGCAWFVADLMINMYSLGNGRNLSVNGINFLNNLAGIDTLTSVLHGAAPFLSLLYLGGLVFLLTRFAREFRFNERLYHSHLQHPDNSLVLFLEQAAAEMGIKRKVNIWLSQLVDTPLTIGFWKPLVLLPVALFNHLSPSQAEAIIIHELHHIKRNDYLVNLFMAFADIFLFFNPFVGTLAGIVKKERENSCDDKVLELQYDMHAYAQALLTLETNRLRQSRLTMAATGRGRKALLNRVKRMAYGKADPAPMSGKLAGCFLAVLLALSAGWPGQEKAANITLAMKNSKSLPIVFRSIISTDLPSPIVSGKEKENNTTPINAETDNARTTSETQTSALLPSREISGNLSVAESVKKTLKNMAIDDENRKEGLGFKFTSAREPGADQRKEQEPPEGLPALLSENQHEQMISYASIPAPAPVLMESINFETGATFSPVVNPQRIGTDVQVIALAPNILLLVKESGEALLLKIKAPFQGLKTPLPDATINRHPASPDTTARIRKIVHI